MPSRILLVGCGNMGAAMLGGWIEQGVASSDIAVVEPAPANAAAAAARGVAVVAAPTALDRAFEPDVVVIAVKPQEMATVIPAYRDTAGAPVFVSVAAGTPIRVLEAALGEATAVIRTMPNTPALVRRGMSVACANARVSAGQRDTCTTLLAAIGEVAWVEDEGLMDAVTGVSGSGPAYVFLLIESLAAAGVDAGLPAKLSHQLALATVAGASELARVAPEVPAILRERVTSPGGTTQAALRVLMAADGLTPLMSKAVAAATTRSRELAG